MNIGAHFNLASLKSKGTALIIEHAPCCILSFAAGSLGVSILNHNPILELGFAIGGAVVGEHIGHKYFSNDCNHGVGVGLGAAIKRYGVALSFGLATWGAHQYYFHDHSVNHPARAPQYDCDHPPHRNMLSFAAPEMHKAMIIAHDKKHEAECAVQ